MAGVLIIGIVIGIVIGVVIGAALATYYMSKKINQIKE